MSGERVSVLSSVEMVDINDELSIFKCDQEGRVKHAPVSAIFTVDISIDLWAIWMSDEGFIEEQSREISLFWREGARKKESEKETWKSNKSDWILMTTTVPNSIL